MKKESYVTEEQLLYAKYLDLGMKIGMALLIAAFVIYMLRVLDTYIPFDRLPALWNLSLHDYLEETKIEHGWGWLKMINHGDFLNFIGVAFLSLVTIVCFIIIIPVLFKKNDKVYAIIAIIEVLVLVLASSGILKSGGH
ncbi:hypothetical protein MCHI_001197 [Candidatus Magnetoovum chiemensis]|nr:hypothetical protein MCHI_001197 [Candidatus Magnetoovum chiemensis]